MIDGSAFLDSLKPIERELLSVAESSVTEASDVGFRVAHDTTLFKDRTGNLRSQIAVKTLGTYARRLIASAEYALYVEEGTKAHPITGHLRFYLHGRWITAGVVRHPGTASRPFMANAAAAGGQALKILLEEGAEHAVSAS